MRPTPTHLRAFSLLETLIAIFLIVMALLVVTRLMHQSLQRGTAVERRLTATLFAQDKLEEIRAWALDPGNFHGDWSSWDGATFTHPDFPDYQVRTSLSEQPLSTPSRLLEEVYPPDRQRILNEACKGVTVECWWSDDQRDRIELNTLVGAPSDTFRLPNSIEITPSAQTLAKDSSASFTAKAFDSGGREIKGLTFSWFIVPKSGTGTLVGQSRDGRTAEIGHWLYALDGTSHTFAPGLCEFAVRARFNGVEAVGSAEVQLQ
ncbi:MAG: hypothetical protein KC800_33010 [Candidatus Eremiobacteraeota bacterium]|nr:hypothetical protein [Candidatus Eremiobacteraeota bacterium]